MAHDHSFQTYIRIYSGMAPLFLDLISFNKRMMKKAIMKLTLNRTKYLLYKNSLTIIGSSVNILKSRINLGVRQNSSK
jgi:hypothetical protein